ncbi:uncharacterized protein LOC123552794 isoform X2 [Mercenaria mercenaria]|uniref:uncharacterized protein LOC123552794 isoform X2 n=1 Tax=Mercenaria mercenaria TaxID=6596 RepID=UPI00234F3A49|nr:uncharacterized protein LOC123552794 isoform X2 [Mercenaria mercenaria]
MQVYIKCIFLDNQEYEKCAADVSIQIMTYRSSHEIQGRFRFFDNEAHLRRDWKQHARANIRQKTFLEGILLKSLDPENPFPYVDYAVFCTSLAANTSNHNIPAQQNSNKPLMFRNCRKLPVPQNGPARLAGTGFYDELEYILRNEVKPLPRTPVSKDSVYFLSVFQTDGHIGRLEETWKTWSGADFILWKCPEKLKLRRVTFFKSTCDSDIYTFIVLCECEDGLSMCDMARAFLERLKDRRCGLVGLYQVERYYIASKPRT